MLVCNNPPISQFCLQCKTCASFFTVFNSGQPTWLSGKGLGTHIVELCLIQAATHDSLVVTTTQKC